MTRESKKGIKEKNSLTNTEKLAAKETESSKQYDSKVKKKNDRATDKRRQRNIAHTTTRSQNRHQDNHK